MIAQLVGNELIKRPEVSERVTQLQLGLIAHGAQLVADGEFGDATEKAVQRFQHAHGLTATGYVGLTTARLIDTPDPTAVPEPVLGSVKGIAPHLTIMRAITGTKEFPGGADNPVILAWQKEIIKRYPELHDGVAWYKHDDTPWCGLGMAYCIANSGYRPPLQPLYALNWHDAWKDGIHLEKPCLGAIGVKSRDGGGHVTLYEGEDDNYYFCRGCNQSDMVNVARFPLSTKFMWMWPKDLPRNLTGRIRTTFNAAVSVKEV